MSPVVIVPIPNSKPEIRKFVTSAWRFYRGNPCWVPPLIGDQVRVICSGPYHEVGVIQPFLALRGGEVAGRIIAHYDNRHNEYFGEKRGCVAFFESENDTAVSRALFGAAEAWLKEKGMNDMQGPFNFTLYDTPGVLMNDYDNVPALELAYNPPYYPDLYTDYGFVKNIDWYAYKISVEERFPRLFYTMWEKVGRDAAAHRDGLVIRELNLKKFEEEKKNIIAIFNEAWSANWGHYPMTESQLDYFVKELKEVVKPEFVLIAEYNGEAAGFILSIPDVNPALKAANGRLFPLGLLKILWNMRNVHRLKTIMMGIRPKYRMRGLDAYFYVETFERGKKRGYTMADMSLIVENNHSMNNALVHMGAKVYKTYRFYRKKF